jgi:hypothetical protein
MYNNGAITNYRHYLQIENIIKMANDHPDLLKENG